MSLVILLLLVLTGPLAPAPAGHAVWPLDPRPRVVARFDPPGLPWGSGHRGVDLLGAPGQPVRAAEAGVVRFAGRIAGRGVVVVDHGGTRTTYQPVRGSALVGDTVAAGEVIGHLELFGSHCFPAACLHWGLIAGRDTYLDPLSLVGGTRVRLLPLYAGAAPGVSGVPAGPTEGSRTWRRAAKTAILVTPPRMGVGTPRRMGVGTPPRMGVVPPRQAGAGALFRLADGQARGWAWR